MSKAEGTVDDVIITGETGEESDSRGTRPEERIWAKRLCVCLFLNQV